MTECDSWKLQCIITFWCEAFLSLPISLFTAFIVHPSIPFLESSVFGMSHLLHIVTHPWSFRLVSCFFFVFLYSFCNNFSSKTYYNVHQIGFFLSFIFQQPGIPYIYHLLSLGGPVSLRLESFLNTLSLPTSVTCSIVPQLQFLWDLFLTCFPNDFRGPVPVDKDRHAEDEDTPDQVEGYANLCAFEEHHLKSRSSQMVMRDLLTFMRRSLDFS